MSEGTPPPIETRMDYSAEDVRGLAEFVDKLAGRISDAVALARSARSDLEEGWDDNTGAKARASLTVGADQAEVLGQKAGGFANTLRTYAGILSRANEHLHDAREAGRLFIEGTVMSYPDEPVPVQPREVLESTGDPDQDAHRDWLISHRDAYWDVHHKVEDAKRTLRETELTDTAENLKNTAFFTELSMVNGGIEQVAAAYNARFLHNAEARAGAMLNWPARTPADSLFNQRLAEQQRAFAVERTRGNPADLVAKISRSWMSNGVTVFGVAFEIYNGVEPEKAIFTGLTGSAVGIAVGLALPVGWSAVLVGGIAGGGTSLAAGWVWENRIPETIKDGLADVREQFQRDQQRTQSEREWGEEYREESGRQWPGHDLKGP